MKLSIISPVYQGEKLVEELVRRIKNVLLTMDLTFEIILVNDGSPDKSWEFIESECLKDKRVKGINLSRNFGQHYAIAAGLEKCIGEWIVVLDCDLQDRPEEIDKLFSKAQEGYDMVLAKRVRRQDPVIKKKISVIFYWFFSYLTDSKYDNSVANFGIYHRKVIEALLSMKDRMRVFPILVQWVGFKKTSIDVTHDKRAVGKTSYTYSKLIRLAIDISISFSNKPLILTIKFGFLMSFIASVISLFYVIKYLNGQFEFSEYTILILSIWFLSGLVVFSVGVLGIYIGKIFNNTKHRPLYIIKSSTNLNNQSEK